jgi:hypothetical protein
MKIAANIVRILLGLAFILFGLMGLGVIHVDQPPLEGHAAAFMGALAGSRYFMGIAVVQIIGGILLVASGRIAPLGLLMIGPVIVNIAFYHIFMHPADSVPAVVVAVLSLFLLYYYRKAFAGLVQAS